MSKYIKALAQDITNRGLAIHYKSNSVFEACTSLGPDKTLEVANLLAPKINNELVLVKNKLRPLMNDIVNYIDNKLAEYVPTSPTTDYDIKVYNYPKVLDVLVSSKVLAPRRDPKPLSGSIGIPLPPTKTIEERFKHRNYNIEVLIQPIRANVTTDGLVDIWNRYLTNITESNPNIAGLGIDTIHKTEELILLYVALDNLLEDYNEPELNKDNVNIMSVLGDYYAEICNFLAINLEHLNLFLSTNQLVIDIKDKTIYVQGELYSKFLEEGGTPDSLLGLIVSGKRDIVSYMYNNILSNKEELTEAWVNKIKLSAGVELSRQTTRLTTLYSILMRDIYDTLIPEDLKELIDNDFDTAHANLMELLDTNPREYVLDIERVARDIVGICIFPKSFFQKFAETMTYYVEVNKNFTPQDGATFASIEFIVDYLLDQLYIGNPLGGEVTNTRI